MKIELTMSELKIVESALHRLLVHKYQRNYSRMNEEYYDKCRYTLANIRKQRVEAINSYEEGEI